MTTRAESADIASSAASSFAALGLLAEAAPLLEPLGWDGRGGVAESTGSLGATYESSLAAGDRRTWGIHYTPTAVADGLVRLGLRSPSAKVRVGDPACGAGAFLLAAARALHATGIDVDHIVAEQLFGADRDPVALAVARLEIARWAAGQTGTLQVIPDAHLVCADSLDPDDSQSWVAQTGFCDLVIGNPPFGSQLKGSTVRSAASRERLETRMGIGPLGYADTAAIFLASGLDLARPGGQVAMILPRSVAAARDAAPIRELATNRAALTDVWIGGDDVGFTAAVSVFAPVLALDQAPRPQVDRFQGATVAPLDHVGHPEEATWASLLAEPAVGAPVATNAGGATLDSVATPTASFRQHYYGLIPYVVDDPTHATTGPVLVTTGAIDPLHHRLRVPVRFAGVDFARPVVDRDLLATADPDLAGWVNAMLVPKVLVASQGRVIEAIVDEDGSMVPSTPVIAVIPTGDISVWHLAAALSAPSAAAALHRQCTGTGMGGKGCRVTARFVASVDLPEDRDAWDRAADEARAATAAAASRDPQQWAMHLDRLGEALTPNEELLAWWREQRPGWRGARLLRR